MRWLPMLLAAVLAGCAGVEREPGGVRQDLVAHEGHEAAESSGIRLEGDLRECDDGVCVDATATNVGDVARHISSICVAPWSEGMERDGKAVQHREPLAVCLAFGTEPLGPAETRSYASSWNGTLWSDRYAAAPPGDYEWTIAFTSFAEAGGGGRDTVAVSFRVAVEETG